MSVSVLVLAVVDFLDNGNYMAVFWICAKHRVDNSEIFFFFLLLSRA